ncbi:asparagine synthase (glutamine-hydrolyzing) [bacterium]|nr:MAG: asparagine synthase (glutamine-hydrolyzing) [bacterium]
MCGILAKINSSIALTENDLNSIRHRGPDAQQIWSRNRNYLGHVRLSIVDLSPAGNQPFHNENDTIHLVCNGEIYNSFDLRNILIAKGHRFISNSDNEVILHGYEEWGVSIVEKLIGMFAFVIWDENEQQVLAARDHVGIKPLYYRLANNEFSASSELQAISKNSDTVNVEAVGYYLGLGYVPSPMSWYKNCFKVNPGHYITWSTEKGLKETCYWQAPTEISNTRIPFHELFHTVLEDHLMADVPIGVFLSAGLDSTTITVGLKELGYKTEALTIGFPDSAKNEALIAEETAKYLGFPNSVSNLVSNDVFDLLKKSHQIYDEPQGYSALLTMIEVSELAAKKYKVILSGDGGDEVFGGYNWYKDIGLNYSSKNRYKLNRLLYQLTGSSKFLNAGYFESVSDLHRHAWRLFPRFLPEQIRTILGIKFDDEMLLSPLKKHFVEGLPLKRALQRVDLMTFCADSINPKVDRASMAVAMEVRVPFLDKRMIEYGISLPMIPEFEKNPKQVLRNYLTGKVPDKVLNQPKQGFSAQMFDKTIFNGMRASLKMKPHQKYNDAQIWMLYNLNAYFDIS